MPSAAGEMRAALHAYGDELRQLPMAGGALPLGGFERLLERMHRTSSRLLWRHLTAECGLLDLLRAFKSYMLLGRGNVFHTLLDELRPLTDGMVEQTKRERTTRNALCSSRMCLSAFLPTIILRRIFLIAKAIPESRFTEHQTLP